jgi:hypothetical protein
VFRSKVLVACVAAATLSQVNIAQAAEGHNIRLTGGLRASYSTAAQATRVGNNIDIDCQYHVSVDKRILGVWVHVGSKDGNVVATVPDNGHQQVYFTDFGHGISVEIWATCGNGDVTLTYIINSPRGEHRSEDHLRA